MRRAQELPHFPSTTPKDSAPPPALPESPFPLVPPSFNVPFTLIVFQAFRLAPRDFRQVSRQGRRQKTLRALRHVALFRDRALRYASRLSGLPRSHPGLSFALGLQALHRHGPHGANSPRKPCFLSEIYLYPLRRSSSLQAVHC